MRTLGGEEDPPDPTPRCGGPLKGPFTQVKDWSARSNYVRSQQGEFAEEPEDSVPTSGI